MRAMCQRTCKQLQALFPEIEIFMADVRRTTFVLIHGAWQGGWAWDTIVTRLQAAGHDAIAIDLPGSPFNPMPAAEVDLARYAEHVAGVIDSVPGPIIMVGHSSGGIAAEQVCELRPDRVALAIYLAAFLLPDGMSLIDFYAQNLEPWMKGAVTRVTLDATGELSSIDPVQAIDVFYHKADRAQAESAANRLTPHPEGGRRSKLHLSAGRFGTVPRVYIETTEDRSVHVPLQRKMQAMTPCLEVYSLDSDHAPQLSDPDGLVATMLAAVARHARAPEPAS
jgi:pimeloyl-ACP methyl ester carboxylesterase